METAIKKITVKLTNAKLFPPNPNYHPKGGQDELGFPQKDYSEQDKERPLVACGIELVSHSINDIKPNEIFLIGDTDVLILAHEDGMVPAKTLSQVPKDFDINAEHIAYRVGNLFSRRECISHMEVEY